MLELVSAHPLVAGRLVHELEEVTRLFERQIASDLSAVNRLCLHVDRYRGKMLRPSLVLLSGLAVQGTEDAPLSDAHRTIAAVIEMIHMATLVHDDVLDDAEIRRRGATVNHLRGNEMAVILGDYLISNAFHLCSTIGNPSINVALGAVTNTLCEGELLQLDHRHNLSLDEPTYFEIVRRKTASLIAEACRMGAIISGADDRTADGLHRAGSALGIAFQIQDDLLDLFGEERAVGKSLGNDLGKGKLTLPVIRHLAGAPGDVRARTLCAIDEHDAVQLRALLEESGSADSARRSAFGFVHTAREEFLSLPESPVRALLLTMADAVVTRDH